MDEVRGAAARGKVQQWSRTAEPEKVSGESNSQICESSQNLSDEDKAALRPAGNARRQSFQGMVGPSLALTGRVTAGASSSVIGNEEPEDLSEDEFSDALAYLPQPLRVQTIPGCWLDRQLHDLFVVAKKTEKLVNKIPGKEHPGFQANGRKKAVLAWAECQKLQKVYCAYLHQYPDEKNWLEGDMMVKGQASASELAYREMHRKILLVTGYYAAVIHKHYNLSDEINQAVRTRLSREQMPGEMQETVMLAMAGSTLVEDVRNQVTLFLLAAKHPECHVGGINDIQLGIADFISRLGRCLDELKKQGLVDSKTLENIKTEFQKEDVHKLLCQLDHDLVEKVFAPEDRSAFRYRYLVDRLRVVTHLKLFSSIQPLLYRLSRFSSAPDPRAERRLLERFSGFLCQLSGELQAGQESTGWDPGISGLFYMDRDKFFDRVVETNQSASEQLKKSLISFNRATNGLYSDNFVAPRETVFRKESEVSVVSEQCLPLSEGHISGGEAFSASEAVGALFIHQRGSPEWKKTEHLTHKEIKTYFSKNHKVPDELKGLSEAAWALSKGTDEHLHAIHSPDLETPEQYKGWLRRAEDKVLHYMNYLEQHPEELWLLQNRSCPGAIQAHAASLRQCHGKILSLCRDFFHGVSFSRDQVIKEVFGHVVSYLGRGGSTALEQLEAVLEGIQEKYVRLAHSHFYFGVCLYQLSGTQNDENILKLANKSVSVLHNGLAAIAECMERVSLLEHQPSADLVRLSRWNNLESALKKVVFEGELAKFKSFTPQCYPKIVKDVEYGKHQAMLINRLFYESGLHGPNVDVCCLLDELEDFPVHVECEQVYQARLFNNLAKIFKANYRKFTDIRQPVIIRQASEKILDAIVFSLKEGWVARHWFSHLSEQSKTMSEDSSNLLSLVTMNIAHINACKIELQGTISRLQAVRSGVTLELEAETPALKPAKVKSRSKFTPTTSRMLESSTKHKRQTPAQLSAQDQLFAAAQALIISHPDQAIVKLQEIKSQHVDNDACQYRADLALAEAAIVKLRVVLGPFRELQTVLASYSGKLDESLRTPPFRYPDRAIYERLLSLVTTIHSCSAQLSGCLRECQTYIKQINNVPPEFSTEVSPAAIRMVRSECESIQRELFVVGDCATRFQMVRQRRKQLFQRNPPKQDKDNPAAREEGLLIRAVSDFFMQSQGLIIDLNSQVDLLQTSSTGQTLAGVQPRQP